MIHDCTGCQKIGDALQSEVTAAKQSHHKEQKQGTIGTNNQYFQVSHNQKAL